jgi:predicted O-methyltransferase YrrM
MIAVDLEMPRLAAEALAEREGFARRVAAVPYERKGVLYSEMFFCWLCARSVAPRRVLESGRARGQSTLLLSLCFPEAEIISIEHDRASPDVAVAAQRLVGRANVRQLFGDAMAMLPRLAQEGDVAVIDGPKGHRALRLAIRLLATGKVPVVFLHDASPGSPERRFLAAWMPGALYSDDARFAAVAHSLDAAARDHIPPANRWDGHGPAAGYGFSLACLPWRRGTDYRLALAAAAWDGLRHRLSRRGAHG